MNEIIIVCSTTYTITALDRAKIESWMEKTQYLVDHYEQFLRGSRSQSGNRKPLVKGQEHKELVRGAQKNGKG